MAEDDRPAADRPREVTIGSWVAGGSSAIMLLVVGSMLSRIKTVDFQESMTTTLHEAGLDMSTGSASTLVRLGLMAVGAIAAAMLVFSVFAARRDRSSRIAMTVLAVPMLLLGIFVQPILAGFAVASTAMLWRGAAADWFAGREPRRTPQPPPPLPPLPPLPTPSTPAPPTSYVGFGQPPVIAQAPAYGQRPVSPARPRRLVLAAALTIVSSGVVAALMGVTAAMSQADSMRGELARLLRENANANTSGLTVDQLAVAVLVMCLGLVVWAVVAIVLAWLALIGHAWARIALVVSAIGAGLFALLGVLAFPGCLLITIAAAVSVGALLHPEVGAWYSAAKPGGPPPPRPPQPW